ncbi:S8 family serine peptidase [Mycoplasma sp. Z355B]|uniref:S8 family serine peptidase n=1 Tax=Mycoplasma sp. Z355B TaxID=3401689 RepID=UPI003AB05F03
MKRNKLLLLLTGSFLSGAIITPMVAASTTTETNTTKIKINPTSSIAITQEQYNAIKDFYSIFYKKMGVSPWHRNTNSTNIDKTSSMNKVGVLEVNYSNLDYLLSSKKDFDINYFDGKENITVGRNNWHGSAVSSIIGSDTGINPDANIYYAALKYTDNKGGTHNNNLDRFNKILEWYKNNNVNIINMSYGIQNMINIDNIDYTNWRSIQNNFTDKIKTSFGFDEWKMPADYNRIGSITDGIRYNKEYFDDLYNKFISLYVLLAVSKLANDGTLQKLGAEDKLIEDFAVKYGMIFVKSSGNENTFRKLIYDAVERAKSLDYSKLKDDIMLMYNYFGHDERYSAYLSSDVSKNLGYEYMLKYRQFKYALIYLHHNNAEFSRVMDESKNNISYQSELLKKFDNYFFKKEAKNIIYTGAVDYSNKPTAFSSFNNSDDSYRPLVSAYGETEIHSSSTATPTHTYSVLASTLSRNGGIGNSREANEFISGYLKYLSRFNGTSMAAPMLTGTLSLLQSTTKHKLSLSDALLLVTGSGNYAATTIENSYTDDFDFNVEKEFWKKNHAKNKTGFGIPKYFNMYKMISGDKIKTYDNLSSKFSDEINGAYVNFSISNKLDLSTLTSLDHLDYKVAFKTASVSTLLEYYFKKWAQESGDSYKMKAVESLIGILGNLNSQKYSKDLDNLLDIKATLEFKNNSNYSNSIKYSKSIASPVEDIYFGSYKNNTDYSLSLAFSLKQFSAMMQILEREYPNSWYGSWKAIGYPNLDYLKLVLREYYFKYIDEVAEIKYFVRVNE